MQPNDYDQPPAPVKNGFEPPEAPAPVRPLNPQANPAPSLPPAEQPPAIQPPTHAPTLPDVQSLPPTPVPTFLQDDTSPPYIDDDGEGDRPPRNKKLLIALAAGGATMIVLFVVVAVALTGTDKPDPGNQNGSSQQTGNGDPKDIAIASTNPQYFFSRYDKDSRNEVLVYIDAVTGKQSKQTLQLNESGNASPYVALSASDTGMNQPVQLTKNGKVLAYSTVRQQPAAGTENAITLPGSFTIMAGSRTGSLQPILAGKDMSQIIDWRLGNDGKVVYWLETTGSKTTATEATLYSVVVNTGQSKKLGTVGHDPAYAHSKLFEVSRDSTVRFYSAMPDGLYQTKYDEQTGKIDYDIITNQSQYTAGSFGELSPDGKHLMYLGTADGAKVVTYRIGIGNGEVQTIFDPTDTSVAYMPIGWSDDSKKLSIATVPHGPAGQRATAFAYQLISYDIGTNEQVKLAETSASGLAGTTTPARYGLPVWSPDKKFIGYGQGEELYFYDLTSGKATQRRATLGSSFGGANAAYGWIQLDNSSET